MIKPFPSSEAVGTPEPVPLVPTFRDLFESQLGFVYNALRRLGVRPAELPDATQEVFVTVAAILGDYDPARPLRPWLYGITYRVGMRYLDVAYRRRELPSEIPEAPDSSPGADAALERSEASHLARLALAKVEPARRAVLVLAHFEGMSVPEIAETLQIPVNTAYSRLHRARQDFSAAARKLGWRGP